MQSLSLPAGRCECSECCAGCGTHRATGQQPDRLCTIHAPATGVHAAYHSSAKQCIQASAARQPQLCCVNARASISLSAPGALPHSRPQTCGTRILAADCDGSLIPRHYIRPVDGAELSGEREHSDNGVMFKRHAANPQNPSYTSTWRALTCEPGQRSRVQQLNCQEMCPVALCLERAEPHVAAGLCHKKCILCLQCLCRYL